MIYTARVNENKVFKLVRWSAIDFNSNLTLYVQGMDLAELKDAFTEIRKLEIFQDGTLIATFTALDTFINISYLGKEFVEGEQIFADTMSITLTKTNIVEQVQRLDDQINGVVDLDSMTLDEVKAWKIKEIGKVCRAEISEGTMVTLPDGTQELFTDTADDEINLTNAAFIAFVGKMLGFELDYIPYHSSGHICQTYTTEQIMTIYMTLQIRLTRLTTKCNMLNCMIRESTSRDEVLAITWDMELPTQYQQRFDEIMTASATIAQAMADAMRPEVQPEDQTEDPVDDNFEPETTE